MTDERRRRLRGRRITDLKTHPAALITVPAFAEHLTVQSATVMKWIRAGTLPAYQIQGE